MYTVGRTATDKRLSEKEIGPQDIRPQNAASRLLHRGVNDINVSVMVGRCVRRRLDVALSPASLLIAFNKSPRRNGSVIGTSGLSTQEMVRRLLVIWSSIPACKHRSRSPITVYRNTVSPISTEKSTLRTGMCRQGNNGCTIESCAQFVCSDDFRSFHTTHERHGHIHLKPRQSEPQTTIINVTIDSPTRYQTVGSVLLAP